MQQWQNIWENTEQENLFFTDKQLILILHGKAELLISVWSYVL